MAGLLTIWQAFTLLIKYLPAIIEAIQRGEDFIELRINLKKFDEAAEKAKETKDTSELENLLNPKPKPSNPPAPGNH